MTNKSAPRAIILAAGEGSRLRPHTLDRPKCLVEVDGKSLLERQLAVLRAQSVEDIVVIGGYRTEMLARPGIRMHLNPRFAETNMVWTLFCAADEIDGEVLICYGDIVYSRDVLSRVMASDAPIAVAIDLDWESYWRARNEDPLSDAETLKLDASGRILEIGQKPKSLDQIQGQYMGLFKLTGAGIDVFKKFFDRAKSNGSLAGKPIEKAYMTDLLQAIALEFPVQSVPVHGGWVEIDTVSDLQSPVTRKRLLEIESDLATTPLRS
jgi:choline kinase